MPGVAADDALGVGLLDVAAPPQPLLEVIRTSRRTQPARRILAEPLSVDLDRRDNGFELRKVCWRSGRHMRRVDDEPASIGIHQVEDIDLTG